MPSKPRDGDVLACVCASRKRLVDALWSHRSAEAAAAARTLVGRGTTAAVAKACVGNRSGKPRAAHGSPGNRWHGSLPPPHRNGPRCAPGSSQGGGIDAGRTRADGQPTEAKGPKGELREPCSRMEWAGEAAESRRRRGTGARGARACRGGCSRRHRRTARHASPIRRGMRPTCCASHGCCRAICAPLAAARVGAERWHGRSRRRR
mmetsp:Transcript_500/g.1202  ORF Transcript_500/g.1202 Transcript_500/m.1202 type:complete len:206 (-) Transcript_500:366-983(-)